MTLFNIREFPRIWKNNCTKSFLYVNYYILYIIHYISEDYTQKISRQTLQLKKVR